MIKEQIESDFLIFFKKTPTQDQFLAIEKLIGFISEKDNRKVFVLNGYAGTGKTALVAALVNMLENFGQKCLLMAPTGRASKVLAKYAEHPAFTIHKIIFRQSNLDLNASFSLNFNKMKNVLFVVDEASMISDSQNDSITGSLLDSLINFTFSNENGCKLLLIGDNAQLPPVGQNDSPALIRKNIEKYGLDVEMATLRNVIRQTERSGILFNATNIRVAIEKQMFGDLPKIRFNSFADVKNVPGNMLIEMLTECYDTDGIEETMVICRSNKRANLYNNGIRNQILWRESELESGDLVMIAKNNYFWTSNVNEDVQTDERTMDFLANGDIAVVQRVRNIRELFGFRFADCTVLFPDYNDCEIDMTVILDTLQAEAPALTGGQQETLFNNVMEDYMDIPQKRERLEKLRNDPYYNAIQIKYAYAVTCHKAQGGQWKNIFVDQGYVPDDQGGKEYYRWLYTAVTRATKTLYLVNWKQSQTDGELN